MLLGTTLYQGCWELVGKPPARAPWMGLPRVPSDMEIPLPNLILTTSYICFFFFPVFLHFLAGAFWDQLPSNQFALDFLFLGLLRRSPHLVHFTCKTALKVSASSPL